MPFTEDAGKGIREGAEGLSNIIKTGERNRWAISLIVSVIFNIIQLIYSFHQNDRVMEIQQRNTEKTQELLYLFNRKDTSKFLQNEY